MEVPKHIKKIFKKTGKIIYDYELLKPNDKVLVALSGGKDSLIMLETLAEREKSLPFKIELIAVHIHIDNVGYKTNVPFLESFCSELDVPLHVDHFDIDLDQDPKKSKCFICSWNRRKRIFELTKELKCNKLAFGHHLDDALETLFMNMMYHGSISSLPQKFSMFEGRVEVIRPLLNISEEELIKFTEIRKYPKDLKSCPHEDKTKRKKTREFIEMMHQHYDRSKLNIFRAMDNIYEEYLPKKGKK